jgi:aureolysin
VESIIVHEFAHGLVYYLTGGIDTGTVERHALNEALADIFAMNVTGEGTIGHELTNRSDPIRVPADPGQLNQPAHTSEFDERLGGHANSTIISHAYHRAMESIGQDAAEQTLYRALARHVSTDGGFEEFRSAMLTAAEELYGRDSDEWEGIHQAFDDVGLDGTWTP